MKKILDESELLTRLSSLPGELPPRHDVWPQISARIAHPASGAVSRARPARIWPLATAASFVVILAAGLLLKSPWNSSEMSEPLKDSAAVPLLPAGKAYYPGSPTSGELEYQAALREFMALNTMPGASEVPKPKWIEQGWDILRQVEVELTAALRNEPDNDFLNSRLAALRARQIELLQQIAALDSASWRNNI